MSVRAADWRYLLPCAPASVVVLGEWPGTREAFERLGVAVRPPGSPSDAVLTDRRHLAGALAAPTAAVLLHDRPGAAPATAAAAGRVPGRAAAPAGWTRTSYLHTPGPEGPALLASTAPGVRRYLASVWSRPTRASGRLRNRVLGGPLGALAASVVLWSAAPEPPYPLAAAGALPGAAAAADGFLRLGVGDDLQRVVGYGFPAGEAAPAWVVKFSRVRDAPDRSAVEGPVLAALAGIPGVRDHVVRPLGTLGVDGAPGVVEPAAPGATLTALLQHHRSGAGAAGALPAAAATALGWSCALGAATARPGGPGQMLGLLRAVLAGRATGDLLDRVARAPGCVAHNDLATWNVLTDGDRVTVVDWEDGMTGGVPVADTAYLVTDVLAELHGPAELDRRPEWCSRLWRGGLAQSAAAFGWVRRAAREAGVPDAVRDACVSAAWLVHAASAGQRQGWVADGPAAAGYLGVFGERWAADPALGAGWTMPGG